MKQKKYITVFGASGNIGTLLLQNLSNAGIPVIAVSRNADTHAETPGVQWMKADMVCKDSLHKTMEDASTVFLLSGHSPHFVEDQCNVIDIAKQQGVGHIVKLSSAAADPNSPFMIPRVHGQVEEVLKTSGVNSTLLRPTAMMQNWLGELASCVKKERKIYDATGTGRRAYIDIRDIAAVGARVLADPAQHISHAYILTGGKAVNYYEVAEAVSNVIHEKVTFVSLVLSELQQRMQQQGKPQPVIDTLLAYAQLQLEGKTGEVSNDVENILGQPPRSIADFFRDYRDAFMNS